MYADGVTAADRMVAADFGNEIGSVGRGSQAGVTGGTVGRAQVQLHPFAQKDAPRDHHIRVAGGDRADLDIFGPDHHGGEIVHGMGAVEVGVGQPDLAAAAVVVVTRDAVDPAEELGNEGMAGCRYSDSPSPT